MNENNEENGNVEQVEKEITLGNAKTGDKIKLHVSEEDAKKLKELIEMQNKQNADVIAENERLKKQVLEKPEYQGAQLNTEQLTGMTKKQINDIVEDVLPSDNEGLPVDMMTFKDDYEMINQLEKLAESGNMEAKKALRDLLAKNTGSHEWEYEGDVRDLYRRPKDAKERAELDKKRQLWKRVR